VELSGEHGTPRTNNWPVETSRLVFARLRIDSTPLVVVTHPGMLTFPFLDKNVPLQPNLMSNLKPIRSFFQLFVYIYIYS
jgi:hypothetical protein